MSVLSEADLQRDIHDGIIRLAGPFQRSGGRGSSLPLEEDRAVSGAAEEQAIRLALGRRGSPEGRRG
ncbi:hypothetical protein HUA76_41515 [Myxococcus sp. CA056]|uniref:hypothetical protein n=1 Tax=unclassified Myxococcus TaxID=2648731 RepID=UPI00157B895C|nr:MULTISPECIES: hypothetical protein [unclassified Myxococcus]NTX17269.1 hypothetical protein [Myxococcus sp. CA056]NTX41666.1 hypothetical protein [Myxococcus sp. CA033]